MSMAGRNRKPGPREPSGQPQRMRRRDGPTPEQEMQDMALLIRARAGDVRGATFPLDTLLEVGTITRWEHTAASLYGRHHRRLFGRGYPGDKMPRGEPSKKDLIEAREFIDGAVKVLLGVSRGAKNAVDNVAVYLCGGQVRMVNGKRPRKAALYLGLAALAKWHRGEGRRKIIQNKPK